MTTSCAEHHRRSELFAFGAGLLLAVATIGPAAAIDSGVSGAESEAAAPSAIQPNPLLSIDQNRATVVERVVATWGDALAGSGAGLGKVQLGALLAGLRSDQLLAASLAGSLDGLRNVLANALTANAPVATGLIHAKALGDAAADLTYTPVVPCRVADTRSAGGPILAATTRSFRVWVASGGFAAQGGDIGNCGIPANPAAVVLNFAAVNPGGTGNLIAFPTGAAVPNSSVINYQSGTFALSNGAIVPACIPDCASQVSVKANGATVDLVLDIVGYFKPPGGAAGNVAVSGNLTLVESTATAGNIMKGTTPFIHNFGVDNTFVGELAGNLTMTGSSNTASGYQALSSNTTGSGNTAHGLAALQSNLQGANNTATGTLALVTNQTGGSNTASGYSALFKNWTGSYNTAGGAYSLYANSTGNDNTAIGYLALQNNVGGFNNIGIGAAAAINITNSSNNIHIGNPGIAGESGTIRIGSGGTHNTIYFAGVLNSSISGTPVLISGTGQLGVASSSARYKDDIAAMDDASAALMRLRPVTFHYKSDKNPAGRTLQYGLIAEEVAEVYPGLVARSDEGKIETVLYQFLPPMLLNEYQKQQHVIEAQAVQLTRQSTRIAELEQDRAAQVARIDALEAQASAIASLQRERDVEMAEVALLKRQVARMAPPGVQASPLALATGK